jgi:hypothetical protein
MRLRITFKLKLKSKENEGKGTKADEPHVTDSKAIRHHVIQWETKQMERLDCLKPSVTYRISYFSVRLFRLHLVAQTYFYISTKLLRLRMWPQPHPSVTHVLTGRQTFATLNVSVSISGKVIQSSFFSSFASRLLNVDVGKD